MPGACAKPLGEGMRHRGGTVGAADDGGRNGPAARAEQAVGDIAGEGKAGDDDDHQPQGARLPRVVGAVAPFGQEGEHRQRDHRITREGLDIGFVERADPAVDFGAQRKDQRDHRRARDRHRFLADPGQEPETQRDHGGDGAGRIGPATVEHRA